MNEGVMEEERIRVETGPGVGPAGYDVVVRPGLIDEVGPAVADSCPANRYAIIADTQVASLYGARLMDALKAVGLESLLLRFPAGEWNKNREIWGGLVEAMLKAGIGRDAAVVALGGGVAGDLAGFVAATYMRGLPYIQVPTTLLAMVDSSVGGKTGVDSPLGKNLIGAFHQPRLVLVDPGLLTTLPRVQLAAGLAEAYKHGLILDAGYFDRLAEELPRIQALDPATLVDAIAGSVRIKAGVVNKDERESGYRAVLNFGHTVAHGLESVSGYSLLHGEAVAIGMVAEARIGEVVGVTEAGSAARIVEVLEAAGLPVGAELIEVSRDAFFEALARDKKRRGGRTRYTLLAEIGRVAEDAEDGWTHAVADSVVGSVVFGEGEERV